MASETDWKRVWWNEWAKPFLKDMGVGFVAIIYPPAGFAAGIATWVQDCSNTMNKLDEDGKLVTITSETFSDMYVKSKKIKDNTVSGISQFKDANPPTIPEIEFVNIEDVSEGYWAFSWLVKNTWVEKKCYTLINVKNNGETPADVWVVGYFPN